MIKISYILFGPIRGASGSFGWVAYHWFSWIFLSMLVQKEVLISIPRHPNTPGEGVLGVFLWSKYIRVWMFSECVFRVQWIIDFLLYPVMPGGKMKPHHLLQEEHPLQVWNFNLLKFHIPN